MRTILLLFVTLFGCLTASTGQTPNDTLVIPNLGKLNFAVPDMPAFKALGTEPSTILRPSTPQAIAATASQFYANGNGILPRNIAIEVAPLILIDASPDRKMELNRYLNRRILHSLRVSVGTLTDTSTSPYVSKLGVGLRLSLIDKGDLRYDRAFLSDVAAVLRNDAVIESNRRTEFLKLHPLTENISQVERDSLYREFISEADVDGAEAEIAKIKEAYKRKNWNAQKLDLALAWAGRSPDSLVSNLGFHRFSGWLTLALPVRQWGQFLFGLNYDQSRNLVETREEDLSRFSLSSRLYAGTNRFKGYLEGQYALMNRKFNLGVPNVQSHNIYLHLGGEYGILDGIWIQGYAGFQRDINAGSSAFTGYLDLRFTVPERIKF